MRKEPIGILISDAALYINYGFYDLLRRACIHKNCNDNIAHLSLRKYYYEFQVSVEYCKCNDIIMRRECSKYVMTVSYDYIKGVLRIAYENSLELYADDGIANCNFRIFEQ